MVVPSSLEEIQAPWATTMLTCATSIKSSNIRHHQLPPRQVKLLNNSHTQLRSHSFQRKTRVHSCIALSTWLDSKDLRLESNKSTGHMTLSSWQPSVKPCLKQYSYGKWADSNWQPYSSTCIQSSRSSLRLTHNSYT